MAERDPSKPGEDSGVFIKTGDLLVTMAKLLNVVSTQNVAVTHLARGEGNAAMLEIAKADEKIAEVIDAMAALVKLDLDGDD